MSEPLFDITAFDSVGPPAVGRPPRLLSSDRTALTIDVVTVSPEMAKRWLGQNTHNRRLKPRAIAAYARDMVAGDWKLTGEAIKFDIHGRMLDGQNRCHAIILANVSVQMLVIRDLAPDTQDVMDTGVKRTHGDQLGLRGIANPVVAGSIAVHYNAYQAGVWTVAGEQRGAPTMTHSEIASVIEAHPEIIDATKVAARVVKMLRLPTGVIGTCWILFSRIEPEQANTFFDRIVNLETRGRGDPIATLIKSVQQDRGMHRLLRPAESFYYLIRTWNAWRQNDQLAFLRTGSRNRGSTASIAYSIPAPQ